MARHDLSVTEPSMADDGFELFRRAYLQAGRDNLLLLPLSLAQERRLRQRVQGAFAHGGVAARSEGELRCYMVAGPSFEYRGLVALLVPEFGHAVAPADRATLITMLYAELASPLLDGGGHLHLIGHFANEQGTTSTLFELGFGAIVREQLRGLSDVVASAWHGPRHTELLPRVASAATEGEWQELAPLVAQHSAYYRESPVFALKVEDMRDTDRLGEPLDMPTSETLHIGDLTPGDLEGAKVYDRYDEEVGEVEAVVASSEDQVETFIVEVGGFWGLAKHTAGVGGHQVSLRHRSDGAVRVYLKLADEELRDTPSNEVPNLSPAVAGLRS